MSNEYATNILSNRYVPRYTHEGVSCVACTFSQAICGKFQFVANNEREQFAAAGRTNGLITVQQQRTRANSTCCKQAEVQAESANWEHQGKVAEVKCF